MSYCRFSHWSDLYIYEGVSGFVCHVAARRRVYDVPPEPMPTDGDLDKLMEWYAESTRQHEAETPRYENIDLPHDGATFSTDTVREMAGVVEKLKAEGYRVPEGLVEDLMECGE